MGSEVPYSLCSYRMEKLSTAVGNGLKSFLLLVICLFVPLLFVLFPIGAFLLRLYDKKQNEHVKSVRKRRNAQFDRT